MNNRTKSGLNILGAALLLGVLGDALLRETPWGLNVPLWTGALVAAMYVLHGRFGAGASWRADGGWLLLPIFFFAAAFAWRDSTTLQLLDGLALFVAFALLAWRTRGRKIRLAGLADYAVGLGRAAVYPLFGLPLVIDEVEWATIPRNGVTRHAWAVARGLFIAVPLLLIFGALLMAADAVFDGIMRETFQLDIDALFMHFLLMLMFAWMTGGFLRGMMPTEETKGVASEALPVVYTSITAEGGERHGTAAAAPGATHEAGSNAHKQSPGSVVVEGGATTADGRSESAGAVEKLKGVDDGKPQGLADSGVAGPGEGARVQASVATAGAAKAGAQGMSLGAVEVGVVLGLLNVLFACFVAVQFRYFFGGAARVMSITELTYSEYARRGFFELTWVAGLVLPLLLGAHALLRRNSPTAERIFRPLAGAQIALLFVIMASAVARMRLYQSEYGLTELRLYTTAFMLWLGVVFIWFAWTVLVNGKRERFACGALVAAFVTVGLLHLVNPDAYIVRANAAHARAGRSFDAEYAASLSADAVPALISALPSFGRDERCRLERGFTENWIPTSNEFDEDWRAWNLARWRARRMVATHRDALSEAPCPAPTSGASLNNSTSAPEIPPPPAPTTNANSATTTDGNANFTTDTTGNANTPTADAATPPPPHMITGTENAAAGASNAARASRAANGKTKQHGRTPVAKRARSR